MPLYRFIAGGTFNGEQWNFTMHGFSINSLQSVQTSWVAATDALWTPLLAPLMANEVVMTELRTAELDGATGLQVNALTTVVNRPGTSAVRSLPPQCSVAVTFRTADANRRGTGRIYLPPYHTDTTSLGKLGASAQQDTVDAVGSMLASLSTDGVSMGLLNRTTRVLTPLAIYDVGDVIDTQRRRRSKLIEDRVSAPVP